MSTSKYLPPNYQSIIFSFLKIALPGLIFVTAMLSLIFHIEHKSNRAMLRSREAHHLTQIKKELRLNLDNVFADVKYLAYMIKSQTIGVGFNIDLKRLSHHFLVFCRSKGIYDQIRLLDIDGMEIIRINHNNDNPFIVSQDQLQSKQDRYYFKESLQLKEGNIYISPLDLNVEHGKVEIPIKPVIRVAIPIFDNNGGKAGVLILNYMGKIILEMLSQWEEGEGAVCKLLLLNSEGYFLKGMQPEDEWGFMYPDRNDRTLLNKMPYEWQHISTEQNNQLFTQNGFFSFDSIVLLPQEEKQFKLNGENGEAKNNSWKLVSHMPQEVLSNLSFQIVKRYLILEFAFVLLVLTGAFFATMLTVSKKQALYELKEREKEYKDLYDNAPNVYCAIQPFDGRIIKCNTAIENMLGYSKDELKNMYFMDLYVDTQDDPIYPEIVYRFLDHQMALENKEIQFKCKDGRIKWGNLTIKPIRGKHHNISEFRISIIDITNTKIVEENLAVFIKCVEFSGEGIGIANMDATIKYVNQSLLNLIKESDLDNVIGKS
ncbi:MAG: PAS domain S-box protein, partial [Desulfobacteraceae bacterium]